MKIPAAHILKQFVDRTQEVADFKGLLGAATEQRIMCIHGPGGIGKSVLLSRMMEECRQREIQWVYIEWEDSRKYNYLDVVRKIRDDTEPSFFQLFTDRVNFYTKPGYEVQIPLEGGSIQNVQVLSGGEIQQSGVTVHVGHKVEIRDSMINIQRPDRDVTENEIKIELTRAFMLCLQALTSEQPLIVILDALEKSDDPTHSWIWGELLERIRDQELTNLFVVLAGRKPFNPDPTFFDWSVGYELRPFQLDHILEYLTKRGLEGRDDLAEFILANSEGGNPLKIAISVNNFIQLRRKQAHG